MLNRAAVDVAVVGGGPAGLAAAIEVAAHGLTVMVLDDQALPGGHSHLIGGRLAAEIAAAGAKAPGITVLSGTSVFAQGSDGALLVETADGNGLAVDAAALVLAPGAVERPAFLPGWTLPGVTSTRKIGATLNQGLLPEGRIVFAGHGIPLLVGAVSVVRAGSRPVALVERGQLPSTRELPWLYGEFTAKGRKILRCRWDLKRRRVPVHRLASDLRVEEKGGRAGGLSWRNADGTPGRVEAEVVVVHDGLEPDLTLPRALGVPVRWSEKAGLFLPETDTFGATPVAGVWLAGAVMGPPGGEASVARGRLAGLSVAHAAGKLSADRLATLAAPWQSVLAQLDRLEARLASLSVPAVDPLDEVVICRCQNVTAGRLREAASHGAPGPNLAQSVTGCAIGTCQGRLCGTRMAAILASAAGETPAEVGLPRHRQLVRPVSLALLAEFARYCE